MSAVLDISPSERELEALWRSFYRNWVAASDELARFEQDARSLPHMIEAMRQHEQQSRTLLDRFEQRMHGFRSRAAAYRSRYR